MRSYLALVMCLALVGCSSSSYSKNMKAATVQSTAVVATKALLDEVPAEKYEAAKVTTVQVAAEVSKFLDTGKIGDLPIDKARDAVVAYMNEKGWGAYTPAIMALFDIAAAQTVPVEKLGADTIAIIKLGLEEVALSANTSRLEWRRSASATAAPAPNSVRVVYRKR